MATVSMADQSRACWYNFNSLLLLIIDWIAFDTVSKSHYIKPCSSFRAVVFSRPAIYQPQIMPANVSSNKHTQIPLNWISKIYSCFLTIYIISVWTRIINYPKPTLRTQSWKCKWCFFPKEKLSKFLSLKWLKRHRLKTDFRTWTFGHLNTIEQAVRQVKLSHQDDMHMNPLRGCSNVQSEDECQ